jgi:hypothetical protein
MRTVGTLAAAALIGTAAIATPAPARAAAWVVPVIIAAVVVGGVVVASQASAQNRGTVLVQAPSKGKVKVLKKKKK